MSISGGTFTGPVTFQGAIAVQRISFSGVATFNAGFTGNHSAGSLLSLSLPATAGSDGQTLSKERYFMDLGELLEEGHSPCQSDLLPAIY